MDDTDDTDNRGHLDGEAIDRRVLDRVRPLLTDPDVTPEDIAALALREVHIPVTMGAWLAYQRHGRGATLIDLRPDAEAAVSYLPLSLLASSDRDRLLPPYIPIMVLMEAYDPQRATLAVVHTTPLLLVYRLDRLLGAIEPVAPLITFDQ